MSCKLPNRPPLTEREIARRHLRVIEMALKAAERTDTEAQPAAEDESNDKRRPSG